MFSRLLSFFCIYFLAEGNSLALANYDNRLLNEYAMLQTHDSSSGEMKDEKDFIVARWSKTQDSTIVEQLDCGARALDYRPYLEGENNNIYAHHGPTVIYKPMNETLAEILCWTVNHPTELVIMQISHCVDARFNNNYYAGSCIDSVLSLLKSKNIHTITNDDCSELASLTMEKALSYENGGLLAVVGCSFGYWDPTLTCYDKEYVCYEGSWPQNTSSVPWNRMKEFTSSATSFVPVVNGILWGFGSNWQSSAESVILGTLHNSSLVLDEIRSNINQWTAQQIEAGEWKYLNVISVDNICHHGNDIYNAIQEYNRKYVQRKIALH
jgi:hypothetical protein